MGMELLNQDAFNALVMYLDAVDAVQLRRVCKTWKKFVDKTLGRKKGGKVERTREEE